MLNSGSRQFGTEAKALVDDVGGLPLALELLRSYLNLRGDLTIAAVRQQLAETGHMAALEEFACEYKDELPTAHERNVAATFQVSWNLASDDGKELLGVMAHLAPAPVPLRLLLASLQWQGSAAANRLSKAIADLHRLSLVDRNELNEPVAHRLILAFVGRLPESSASGGRQRRR